MCVFCPRLVNAFQWGISKLKFIKYFFFLKYFNLIKGGSIIPPAVALEGFSFHMKIIMMP